MDKEIKKRGRSPDMQAIQLDLQEKLYNHPDNQKVIETIYRAALDDNHKNPNKSCILLILFLLIIIVLLCRVKLQN